MSPRLLVGTVRARQGAVHVVAFPDGTTRDIVLRGDEVPRIGGDVIGVVDLDQPRPELRLVRDVAAHVLKGRTLISVSGRPDVTARMLGRLLEGCGPAMVRPGEGGIIERTPEVSDPDLRWALDLIEPEALQVGLALNLVDPFPLASSPWSDAAFREDILPADVAGAGGAMGDLKAAIADGFRPSCRLTVQELARRGGGDGPVRSVSSVDFVMPFSPFATGHSFSTLAGAARRGEVARRPLTITEARRISAFREMSLAFAQRHLGKVRAEPGMRSHVEDTFADVAAVTAFVKTGGPIEAALAFARLREAALARWDGTGRAPPATHVGLCQVVPTLPWIEVGGAAAIFAQAASVATSNAPRTAKALALAKAAASDADAFVDLRALSPHARRRVAADYERDLRRVVTGLGGNQAALDRLARLGVTTVPAGLEATFNGVMREAWDPDAVPGLAREDAAAIAPPRADRGAGELAFPGF